MGHATNNEFDNVADGVVYTPEEAALVMHLKVFVNLRWLAIVGVFVAVLIATQVFHISFPVGPVYVICVFIAVYNLLLLWQVRTIKSANGRAVAHKVRFYSNIHIILDLLSLAAILHFTGGIENPFILFFVFHILIASIVLNCRTVYMISTLAILIVALFVGLEYTGTIPHINLDGFATENHYRQMSYIVAVLISLVVVLYGSAYMATTISGELRKRQLQVIQLKERLLKDKTQELEQSSQQVSELQKEKAKFLYFLGVAAHDLKAPLAAIQSYIGVMLGGFSGEINEKQKNMLERSSYRITELLNLISDLLDIPRIETGQIVQEMKDITLKQIIDDCLADLQRLADEKRIKVIADLPTEIPIIRGSSPRLQQVIINLLNNAISYTPQDGIITLKVTVEEKDIKVEISDTGIGIPPQELPRTFEDFFRASNVEIKGTGLGLSITKRIVEAHNGRIWVESPRPDNNLGSRFTFVLPRKN